MVNFGSNRLNNLEIRLDVNHTDQGTSLVDWGQLLYNPVGLFANIRYFYVSSSNHYPGSQVTIALENDSQLYAQNLRSELSFYGPDNELITTNIVQSSVSYGADEPVSSSLTIPALGLTGNYRIALAVYDNQTNVLQETREVEFQVGSYLPQISVLSANVDFGQIFTGNSENRNLVVRNIGMAPLQISSLTTDNPLFTVVDTPYTLSQNQSVNIGLVYSPIASGSHTAILTINSNDPATPVYQVSLSGSAISPPQISLSENSLTKQLYTSQTGSEQIVISQ